MNQVDLRYLAQHVYGRYVPDDVQLVERNGYIFFGHWKRRYDPITLLVLTAVGTGLGIAGTLKQGRESEKIAKQRAQIDLDNAAAVRTKSVEEARIKAEKGRRLRATQKSQAAAGGIRINEGAPLVIELQTLAEITDDIGFGLEHGRVESAAFRSSAAIEIAAGKQAKKKSRFDALQLGLAGITSLSSMAKDLPGKTPGTTKKDITFTGSSAGFGAPTHTGGSFA